MAIVVDRITKQIETRDTVEALANEARWLVYHKRTPPPEVYACPQQYRVIDGDDVRVATAAERVQIDADIAADQAAVAAAALAERRATAKKLLASLDDATVIALRAVVSYLVKRQNETRTKPGQAYPALTAQDVRDGLLAEIDALNGS